MIRRTLDLSLSDRISDQDITVVGRTRGQVLVDARTGPDQVLRNPIGRKSGNPGMPGGVGLVEFGFSWQEGSGTGQPVPLRTVGSGFETAKSP